MFNANEIFEIAVELERNGARFYRKAAENTDNSDFKDTLLTFAAMEDDHERIFIKMQDKLKDEEWVKNAFDPDGEAAKYLKAMVEGKIFDLRKDPVELLSGHESVADILKLAISLEKDAVNFYTGIKETVTEDLGKTHISRIIKEEMHHVTVLTNELNNFM